MTGSFRSIRSCPERRCGRREVCHGPQRPCGRISQAALLPLAEEDKAGDPGKTGGGGTALTLVGRRSTTIKIGGICYGKV